jgi:C4-dicarboxylate-specific signal transduction histidine kinase
MLNDPQIKDLGIEDMVKKAFSGQRVILPPVEYNPEQVVEDFELKNVEELRTPWIQCHLYPVKNPNGDIVFIVNTYVDITDLKKAEEKSNKQKNIIAQAGRATRMGQLAAAIGHELTQPLTGILSNAQAGELMLKSDNMDEEEFKNILVDIIKDTKRAGEVIRNLNEMYRKQKVEFLPFNLIEVISDTLNLLHSELVMQHIMIDIKCKASILTLNGNKIQIQQVLVNLFMNGIHAMRDTKRDDSILQILTSFDDNQVEIRVVDSGTGIQSDNIETIFEPLTTWKTEGIGMGLAISNSIIESHGGRMWAENRPEGGAIVGFSIPLHKEN